MMQNYLSSLKWKFVSFSASYKFPGDKFLLLKALLLRLWKAMLAKLGEEQFIRADGCC